MAAKISAEMLSRLLRRFNGSAGLRVVVEVLRRFGGGSATLADVAMAMNNATHPAGSFSQLVWWGAIQSWVEKRMTTGAPPPGWFGSCGRMPSGRMCGGKRATPPSFNAYCGGK